MQGSGLPGRGIPPISQPESAPGRGVAAEAALAGIARRILVLPVPVGLAAPSTWGHLALVPLGMMCTHARRRTELSHTASR
jgi:hypothetical protein